MSSWRDEADAVTSGGIGALGDARRVGMRRAALLDRGPCALLPSETELDLAIDQRRAISLRYVDNVARDVRPLDWLVAWYGLWQAGHLIFNVVALATGFDSARSLLGGDLTDEQWRAVVASGYLDALFVSPLALLFAFGHFRRRRWAVPIGHISLTGMMVSAFYVYYLQYVYAGRLALRSPAEIAVLLSWIPCVFLAIAYPTAAARGRLSCNGSGAVEKGG